MRHRPVVPPAKSIAICFTHLRRKMRVTVLIAIVHVWPSVIVKVPPRAFHAIVESTPLNVIELRRKRIPLRRRPRLLVLRLLVLRLLILRLLVLLRRPWLPVLRLSFAHQMRHRAVIPAPESIAIGVGLLWRKTRVTELFVIICIRTPLGLKIPARCIHPIVKPMALKIIQFLRRCVPAITGRRRALLS
jgi:hypothetical protein